MTKEELKQEAEEYYYDRLDPKAIDSISEIADADTEDFIVSAYLASAEPREKRIEELEKENAELKRNKKTVVHLAECLEEKQKDQLTKAKDLLLKLSTCLEGHSNNNFEYELILNSEVEK